MDLNEWVVQAFGEKDLMICSLKAENDMLRRKLAELEEKKVCPE
jgi:hypothetical protein